MLVLGIRCDGETLLIAIKPPGRKSAKVVLCGPTSFAITRGGSITEAARR